ncbi:unnamed protein product, partial [Brenthis ino]
MQQSSASATPSCSSKVVILSNVPYHGDLLSHKKRQNKATKDSKKYKRNVNKELRMRGENYLGYRRDRKAKTNETFKVKQDVFKPARSMKPPCASAFCKKSKLRSCDNINEQQRQYLFENFWKNMNWEQRRSLITSHVNKVPKKITKNPELSKRTDSRTYVLTIDNPLPHRPTPINSIKQINHLQKLYAARIPITKRKQFFSSPVNLVKMTYAVLLAKGRNEPTSDDIDDSDDDNEELDSGLVIETENGQDLTNDRNINKVVT